MQVLISVMLRYIHETFHLVNCSFVYSISVIADVLGQVTGLIFLVDFYIIDMEDDKYPNSSPILLETTFIRITRTKINMYVEILTMKFDGEII